jgi:hypothetical protein
LGVVVDAPAPPGLLHRLRRQWAATAEPADTGWFDRAGLAALLAGSHPMQRPLAASAPLRLDDVQIRISAPKTSGAGLEVPNVALLEGSDPFRATRWWCSRRASIMWAGRPNAAGDSIWQRRGRQCVGHRARWKSPARSRRCGLRRLARCCLPPWW